MANIPEQVRTSELIDGLKRSGLQELSVGKVRHTFALPDHPSSLLQIASDRVSIVDFVLPALVRDKGPILTAMTVFWLTEVLSSIPNHLLAYGPQIDAFLPSGLQGNALLQERALVVRRLEMLPVECIVRGYLTGSAWSAYRDHKGVVCGIQLREGLSDGIQLPDPIFTPTTKAEVGHDEHLLTEEVERDYPGIGRLSIEAYKIAHAYAINKGVALADTKLEFGLLSEESGAYILADEVFTPDSSRFWDLQEWMEAVRERKSPSPKDKQFLRNWGAQFNFGSLKDTNLQDLEFVASLEVPALVLAQTNLIYGDAFERIVGMPLIDFQREGMGIR